MVVNGWGDIVMDFLFTGSQMNLVDLYLFIRVCREFFFLEFFASRLNFTYIFAIRMGCVSRVCTYIDNYWREER